MMKIILLSVFFSVNIFAFTAQDFMDDINSTYSKDIYISLLDENTSMTLLSYENNDTQRQIKEEFEKLLPKYMETDDLFSNTNILISNTDEFLLLQVHFEEFIIVSMLYIKLLQKQEKTDEYNSLLEKNLSDINALMVNATNIVYYSFSIMLYQKIYASIACNTKDTYAILMKNTPPDKSLFFEKLENEKQKILSLIVKINGDKLKNQRLISQVNSAFEKYINNYFNEMSIVIKAESEDALAEFNEHMKKENIEHINFWNMARLTLSTIKAKILNAIFGYNHDYEYSADFIGKTLALAAVPELGSLYLHHRDLVNQYRNLLKTYEIKTPT